jgi:hypothetical protein
VLKEEEIVNESSCRDSSPTAIKKESMKCKFVIYNGSGHNQAQVYNGEALPVSTFVLPCFSNDDSKYTQYIIDKVRDNRKGTRKESDR